MMWNYANNYGLFGLGIFGALIAVLWWILVITVIVEIIRWAFWAPRRHWRREYYSMQDKNEALEILKARYAKGEIDKTEFEMKKKDLS